MNVLRFGPDIVKGTIACAVGAGVTIALGLVFGFEGDKSKLQLKKK